MIVRRIYGPIAALCATVVLLPQSIPSASSLRPPLRPVLRSSVKSEVGSKRRQPTRSRAIDTLPPHQVVTFHSSSHLKLEELSIEQIAHSMRNENHLPVDAGVTIHHNQYRAQEGVVISKNDSTVFIFARGFEPRPCAARAARLYENHVIPTDCPVIGFDFDDQYRNFSFGQDKDIALLKEIYERVLQQNPSAQIVLIGNCNGAKVAM